MGRADYLGPVVNQAARVCDAAAHGGQVAVEQGLARKVLQHWTSSRQTPQQQPCAAPRDAAAVSDVHAVAAGASEPTGDFVAVTVAGPTKQQDAVSGVMSGVKRPAGPPQHVALVPVQVVVQQLGSFLLKGCAKSLNMVNFTPQSLAGRQYPEGPPKGKGVRLAHTPGVVGVATVLLPSQAAGVRAFV